MQVAGHCCSPGPQASATGVIQLLPSLHSKPLAPAALDPRMYLGSSMYVLGLNV